jgi:protein SCO1
MKPRAVRLALVFGAFVAGLMLCFAVILILAGPPAGSGGMQASIGGPFRLTDQDGRTITERDFAGKPFLVFFGFTHCPDVCPTTLFDASEVMRALGSDADKTAALFVSVHPERDTPAVLKDYLSSFAPHVRGATSDAAGVTAITKTFRVYYKKVATQGDDYTMDHTALVYLMDKNGRFVAPFNLKRPPEVAAADLRRYF